MGGTTGMERRIVGGRIRYYGIPTGKLRRYFSFENLWDLFRVAAGIVRAWALVRRLRPDVLFSKGGFVSVPPVIAAKLLGVPVVSHESDADPGLATRINARFSDQMCVAYESTRRCFHRRYRNRVTVTGNPLRNEILRGNRVDGLRSLGFSVADSRPVVLFLGGSLGAQQINELVEQLLPTIGSTWRVVHQTGTTHRAGIRRDDHYAASYFGPELPDILAAADLVVCRAGASTLWEVAVLGIPMLLVPLAGGSRGDQVRNAAIFARAGAAVSLHSSGTLAGDAAAWLARYACDKDQMQRMGERARALVRSDAADRIADIIIGCLGSVPAFSKGA